MKSILRHLRDLISAPSPVHLPDEIYLPALGQEWTVRYRKTGSRSVQARSNGSGVLIVSGKIEKKREVILGLRRWLVRQTRASLVPWLEELSAQSGLPFGTVSVRGQKTRWASCSSRGNINLNYRLLFLRPEVVRYILNHELCHTVHLNHSRGFWNMVSSLEPEYRSFNSQAKKGMEDVPEWAKMQYGVLRA
ncbi:MAG: M48 family metallopeptidase [bacterium]|nr:M48 family metallopeptidase [bacterium]MDT8367322.1 M48 family metallopeptidase [bacterium]